MSELVSDFRQILRRWSGSAPCCGTTNHCCSRPPAVVVETLTGCEVCGHPKGCHALSWRP